MKTDISVSESKNVVPMPRTQIGDRFGVIPIPLYTNNPSCRSSCIYCPTVKNIPKSYLANEDTERAKYYDYQADKQLDFWLSLLDKSNFGIGPFKVELIILGGTFGDLSHSYRIQYFKKMYDRLNETKSENLDQAKYFNRSARYRACIVTVETRPDTIDDKECDFLRSLGVSKIELGIESMYDDILSYVGRPYGRDEIIEKSKLIREKGFKLGYHIMLNLPKSTPDLDLKMLKELSNSEKFRPDFLKLYPLALTKNRMYQPQMWDLFTKKLWQPYTKDQLLSLLLDFKKQIPNFIRIQRIQRQFEEHDYTYEGFAIRRHLYNLLNHENASCQCIRCQECRTYKADLSSISKTGYNIIIRNTGDGNYFVAMHTNDKKKLLLGYIRFIVGKRAIIREIKVIGRSSNVGAEGQLQGIGLGTHLLKTVENYVLSMGYTAILINASPGVNIFFEKLGYIDYHGYLKKDLYEKA